MDTLTVPATLDSLGSIRAYVMEAAAAADLEKKASYHLRLAVDEIATNAVVHGHAGEDGRGVFRVGAEVDATTLRITLEDHGEAYDPRAAPAADHLDAPLEHRPIGHLGLYLVMKSVDEFFYERAGEWNRNIFVMRRAPMPAEARLQSSSKLADDLIHVILPIGIALSGEKNFDRLLERILIHAKALCNADGGTLYLRDGDRLRFAIMRNDSLNIATGGTTGKEVRYPHLDLHEATGQPDYHHVASYVALRGHSISIPDIYDAKEFDFSGTRSFDEKNHYRSISTFTTPLKSHDGDVIGVLQLLNAQDPGTGRVIPFDTYMQQLVEALASQAAVALNNRMLLERQKELLRYENELRIGQQIQASFLPDTLPQPAGWEIAATFHPAHEVAGDFYDAFDLGATGKIALIIGDVCDKGVGAALFMALTRSLIRAFAELNREGDAGLKHSIQLTNDYILRNHMQANMFVTLFCGVLDPTSGQLTYVNSGHNPPVTLSGGAVKARLRPTGPAVGMFLGIDPAVHQVILEPGDMLLAFTDGITEARDSGGGFFTEQRLLSLLEPPAPSAAALLKRIEESVRAYVGPANQSDDITMIAARRKSGPEG